MKCQRQQRKARGGEACDATYTTQHTKRRHAQRRFLKDWILEAGSAEEAVDWENGSAKKSREFIKMETITKIALKINARLHLYIIIIIWQINALYL